MDRALAKILPTVDPEEDAFLTVAVDETEWAVASGRSRVLPDGNVRSTLVVFEVLRRAVTMAQPHLPPGVNVLWLVRQDGELCIAYVRDRNRPEWADVYVGWPAYVLEPSEACKT